jgi:hypothetical protein
MLSCAFTVYVYFVLLFNHSLFRGTIFFMCTIIGLIIITCTLPITISKSVSFADLVKSIFTILPFMLAVMVFIYIQSITMLKNLNEITEVNYTYLSGSILFLFVLIIPIFLSSYLSDNVNNSKLKIIFYRIFIFSILFFICILISLFGSIVSYYTYIPGPKIAG